MAKKQFKRLKGFEMFKESYLSNEEEEDLIPDELDAEAGMGEEPMEEPMEDDSMEEPMEDDSMGDDMDDMEDGDSELEDKVRSIMDENYAESLEDMVNGIVGELEEGLDTDDVIDAILDCIESKVEEILATDGEESMEEEPMEDDSMEDDSMEDDSMEDDSMEDDSMEDDSMEDDSMGEEEESIVGESKSKYDGANELKATQGEKGKVTADGKSSTGSGKASAGKQGDELKATSKKSAKTSKGGKVGNQADELKHPKGKTTAN